MGGPRALVASPSGSPIVVDELRARGCEVEVVRRTDEVLGALRTFPDLFVLDVSFDDAHITACLDALRRDPAMRAVTTLYVSDAAPEDELRTAIASWARARRSLVPPTR